MNELKRIAAAFARDFIREYCSFMARDRKAACYKVTRDMIYNALLAAKRRPVFSQN